MRQTAMSLDRIDKIDRIGGCAEPFNPVNPVNPVRRSVIPKLMNTERPAAGRREMTGSFASRLPVGFVARSLAGVWGEAPVQDSQTAGRKKRSRRTRSIPPATLPLPREAALCFSKNSRVSDMTCARGGCASRFVFARSAAPLHERFIFTNTERPAAGRREMTGSLASRMPVGFVARSPAGVWGEAPVQDSQTAGRKKSSLNARSASPATLPLPREAALCLKTKTCQ